MKLETAPPKTRQVADWLRGQIRGGDLAPGERVYSLRTLAKRFDVSVAVIHSAFDMLERERLIVREAGRGTFVRDGVEREVPPVVLGLFTEYTRQSSEGYFESLGEAYLTTNCVASVVRHRVPDAEVREQLDAMRARGMRGVLVDLPQRNNPLDRVRRLVEGIPHCYVHHWEWPEPPAEGEQAVLSDFTAMYRTALRYLFTKGHQRILIAGHHEELAPYHTAWMRRAAADLGLIYPGPSFAFVGVDDLATGRDRPRRVLEEEEPPTAILGFGDYLVHNVDRQLRDAFPDAPPRERVGCYDTQWAKPPHPPMHSFHCDFRAMWNEALGRLAEPETEREPVVWLTPRFVERPQPEAEPGG